MRKPLAPLSKPLRIFDPSFANAAATIDAGFVESLAAIDPLA